MAISVERPYRGHPRGSVHHARPRSRGRPSRHQRDQGVVHVERHAGRRRRDVLRDVALALLTLALAAGVVVVVLRQDPAMQAEVLDVLRTARTAVVDQVTAWTS